MRRTENKALIGFVCKMAISFSHINVERRRHDSAPAPNLSVGSVRAPLKTNGDGCRLREHLRLLREFAASGLNFENRPRRHALPHVERNERALSCGLRSASMSEGDASRLRR